MNVYKFIKTKPIYIYIYIYKIIIIFVTKVVTNPLCLLSDVSYIINT